MYVYTDQFPFCDAECTTPPSAMQLIIKTVQPPAGAPASGYHDILDRCILCTVLIY